MHLATLLIELGAVIFGLSVVGRLAGKVGISPIPLYLVAGLAFGSGGLLPLAAPQEFIQTGGEVGVVLLLLLLGLEYSAGELVGTLRRQAPVGVLDVVLNGVPGAALALLMGWGPVAAIAMFGVTAVSSSGIVAKVLTDLRRLGNRETPSILGVLVLEDLAMAVFLPVLTAVLAASGPWSAMSSVLVAIAILALVLLIALRYGRHVSRFVFTANQEILLLRILGLALLVAGFAESVHVSAAVGAFLLGIALSGEVAENVRRLLEPLRDLFAAMFFVFFGLSTDPGALPPVILPAIGLVLVGVATKFVTGWFAAARDGVGTPGRVRAGAALIARGEFSIVIAGLATAGGVTKVLAPTTAAYVLALAVIGPLAARLAEPVAHILVRRRRAAAAARTAAAQTAAARTAAPRAPVPEPARERSSEPAAEPDNA
ncbi:cation:proton antiporter [Actinopolymorpha alba]|uniref:cation:proton antiporter n=1 Tax=Actinopolymorpha alba TaxID=533267 RepID=UPI00035E3E20|nr:cation:proton antiporter [Actinopolymorpha alba]